MTLGALKSSEGKWPLNSEEYVYLMESCCESPADMFRNQNIYDLMIKDMFCMLSWRQRGQHLNSYISSIFSDYNTNAIFCVPKLFQIEICIFGLRLLLSYKKKDLCERVQCYRSIGKR